MFAPIFLAPLLLAAAPQAPAITADQLKSEIDRSIRWLRTQQDLETGAYESPLGTAWTLAAMVESPRRYKPADGPYVAKALEYLTAQVDADGIVGGKADELDATAVFVLTLEALGTAEETALAERLKGGLQKHKRSWPWEHLTREFASPETGALIAEAFLGKRGADGAWDGPRGKVVETAQLTWELSRAHRALSSVAKPSQAPSDPVPLPELSPADAQLVQRSLARGARFLVEAGPEGRWGAMGRDDPGIGAMVVGALLSSPEPRDEAVTAAIDAGLDWLVSLQKADGSIHDGQLANYVTSASILALVRAGRESDGPVIERARDFLVKLQADEGDGYDESHRYYGGVGYGGDERPDLSNLQMALEAMDASGLEDDDPAFSKALRFLQRVQNRTESNDLEITSGDTVIRPGNDGGAGYAPGESKAGFVELEDGTQIPRSYGSMTYALLKGYLFAGLDRDDPRVRATWTWLRENYTLDVNPGFEASDDPHAAYQGLFYYFYTMARALDLYGEEVVVDAAGAEHAWRTELSGRLVSMQQPDGSWTNGNSPRWWEGNPVLATAYAMLTLDATLPDGR